MAQIPIDRGWAWMICLGSAVQSLFVSGGMRVMGILFVEITERFQAQKSVGALTLGLVAGGFAIFAIVSNMLSVLFGIRQVVLAGNVLLILALGLSVPGVSVWYLIILLGLVSGLAYGAMMPPAVVLTNHYFHKRKSFANGLAMAGSSVGQMCLPYLITYLLYEYSYPGAMLIYTGITLHVIPAMMLLRPVTFWSRRSASHGKKSKETDDAKLESGIPSHETNGKENKILSNVLKQECKELSQSLPMLPNEPQRTAQENADSERVLLTTLSLPGPVTTKTSFRMRSSSSPTKRGSTSVLPALSIEHLAIYDSDRYTPSEPDPPIETKDNPRSGANKDHRPVKKYRFLCLWMRRLSGAEICKLVFDPLLMKSPFFWMLFLGSGLGNAGYVNVTLHLPALAVELFNDRYTGALFMAIVGPFDMFGRLGGGWFADRDYIKRTNLMGVVFTIQGASTIAVMFYPHFWLLTVYVIVMGLFGGLLRVLLPVIIGDLFGRDKIGSGLGMMFVSVGIMIVPIPPLLGYIEEVYGSYIPAFYLCGALLLLAATIMYLFPCVRSKSKDAVISTDM